MRADSPLGVRDERWPLFLHCMVAKNHNLRKENSRTLTPQSISNQIKNGYGHKDSNSWEYDHPPSREITPSNT